MDHAGKQINALMSEWAELHRQRGWSSFISDGLVNEKSYEAAPSKICFFLKEAYSKDGNEEWSLTDWLSGGAMTRMWSSVAEWTYGIIHTSTLDIPSKPNLTVSEKSSLLQSIAVVNVKKSNGTAKSDYVDLLKYAQLDKEYLRREIEILNPDIIVCGNNSSLLRFLYGASIQPNGKVGSDGLIDYHFMRQHGYALLGSKIILDYYHPANQYPAIMNYYTICSLYQQALNMKG